MRRWLRRGLLGLSVCLAVLIAWIASALQMQTTAAGIPVRWLLPISADGPAAIAVPIVGTPARARIPGFLDGPVVERDAAGGWRARWFCEDRVQHAQVTSMRLEFDCLGNAHAYELAPAIVPDPVQAMPSRIFVLSDLEGDAGFLRAALLELGLTDAVGAWSGKDAHLVINGDSVDRGRDVFQVLWTLRRLQREADAAGGAVHVLIGNHEQCLLRGIGKSVHPEHRHGLARLGGQRAAFGKNTLIGDWLRRLPVAVRLGDILFVHAGLSPDAAKSVAGPAAANAVMRTYWNTLSSQPRIARDPALDAILGERGVTQFRGLLLRAEGSHSDGGTVLPIGETEIERSLLAWQARRMVIAHTIMHTVHAVHGDRVWAVDVADARLQQTVLAFSGGIPRVLRLAARRQAHDADWQVRRAELSESSRLLWKTADEQRQAAAIPMPY